MKINKIQTGRRERERERGNLMVKSLSVSATAAAVVATRRWYRSCSLLQRCLLLVLLLHMQTDFPPNATGQTARCSHPPNGWSIASDSANQLWPFLEAGVAIWEIKVVYIDVITETHRLLYSSHEIIIA